MNACQVGSPYDRQEIVSRCEQVLESIRKYREGKLEKALAKVMVPRRKWGWIGPKVSRTREEGIEYLKHDRFPVPTMRFIEATCKGTEIKVAKILQAAENVQGDTVFLTVEEFNSII